MTQPSTSTLTNFLTPIVFGVSSNTVTVNWPAFDGGSGTNTAQGYELDASYHSNFSAFHFLYNNCRRPKYVNVSGLTPFTTYYLRAGSINWNSVCELCERHSAHRRMPASRTDTGTRRCSLYTSVTVTTERDGNNGYESTRRATIRQWHYILIGDHE